MPTFIKQNISFILVGFVFALTLLMLLVVVAIGSTYNKSEDILRKTPNVQQSLINIQQADQQVKQDLEEIKTVIQIKKQQELNN